MAFKTTFLKKSAAFLAATFFKYPRLSRAAYLRASGLENCPAAIAFLPLAIIFFFSSSSFFCNASFGLSFLSSPFLSSGFLSPLLPSLSPPAELGFPLPSEVPPAAPLSPLAPVPPSPAVPFPAPPLSPEPDLAPLLLAFRLTLSILSFALSFYLPYPPSLCLQVFSLHHYFRLLVFLP